MLVYRGLLACPNPWKPIADSIWSEIRQQVLHKHTEGMVHVNINSLWDLLAVAVVKVRSLNSFRRMRQTSPHLYISIYLSQEAFPRPNP